MPFSKAHYFNNKADMKQKNYLNLIHDFNTENKIKIIDRFLGDSIPSNTKVNSYLSNMNIEIESIILTVKVLISKSDNSTSNHYKELFRYRYNIDKEKRSVLNVIDLLNYSIDPLINESIDYNDLMRKDFYDKLSDINGIALDRIKGIYVRLTYTQRNKKS